MKSGLRRIALAVACAAGFGALCAPSYAANWLMLQGTEPASSSARAYLWGFIQAQYQKDNSDANPYLGTPGNNYKYVPAELIGPNLTSQSAFNVNRARIGVRGTGFPLDSTINYFLLAEFGNNALNATNSAAATLTDASITVNRIPHARIRVGTFKYPTAEEAFQGIATFDYINFTEVTNQMLLERFPNRTATLNRNNVAGFNFADDGSTSPYNRFDRGVDGFRDTGIQIFDAFKTGNWEHSYAVMYGNGNGVNFSDNDSNKDTYLYWSSEKLFGGSGPFRQGLKFFVWHQKGKRTLYNPATPFPAGPGADKEPAGKTEYDRMREGLGVAFRRGQFRATAEYMKGKGMIFLGPDNPSFTITAPCLAAVPPAQGGTYNPANGVPTCGTDTPQNRALLADGRKGESNGWYVEGGWYIPNSDWELDARYDVYKRLTNATKLDGPCAFEFDFKTTTLGAQYHFNKKTRLTMNAAARKFEAVDCPAPAPGGNPNNNLDGVDKRYSIQLTHVF